MTEPVDHSRQIAAVLDAAMADARVETLDETIRRMAAGRARAIEAEAERRLLAGENKVTIGNYTWTVPSWRSSPRRRLRIEWLRWRRRDRCPT